eukprot:513825_1
MISAVKSKHHGKYKPWIFNLVNKRLHNHAAKKVNNDNNNNSNNSKHSKKYICQIQQIFDCTNSESSRNLFGNAPFECKNSLMISDGEYTMRCYTNSDQTTEEPITMYRQNQNINLKKFVFHMSPKHIYLIILKSKLYAENISFNKNQKAKSVTNIVNTFNSQRLANSSPYKINAKSVKLFFPYPIFKMSKYSLILDANNSSVYDVKITANDSYIPPAKKQKLNENNLKINHISGKDEFIETILKSAITFSTSNKENTNNNESKQNAFADVCQPKNHQYQQNYHNNNAFSNEPVCTTKQPLCYNKSKNTFAHEFDSKSDNTNSNPIQGSLNTMNSFFVGDYPIYNHNNMQFSSFVDNMYEFTPPLLPLSDEDTCSQNIYI